MAPKRPSNSEPNTKPKKFRRSVTLQTKLDVVHRIESGEKVAQICKVLGLAKSTVQTIRDKKEQIKKYSESAAPFSKLTRQRSSVMEKMEKLLVEWIEENNRRKIPMSQVLIQEKAKDIFENLKKTESDESARNLTFQGSRGWFEKFKNRQNLHNKSGGKGGGLEQAVRKVAAEEDAMGECLVKENAAEKCVDKECAIKEYATKEYATKEYATKEYATKEYATKKYAALEPASKERTAKDYVTEESTVKEYANKLRKIITKGEYQPEQVFNVEETALYWKRTPEGKNETSNSTDRFTLLLGANASGDFKLTPLLVYQSDNPCFKGFHRKQSPIISKSNKKGGMTKALFEDWFKNYFCPEVKQYLIDNNLSGNALLILNKPHQKNLAELAYEDVKVEYIPKNTTAPIQPMNRGVIAFKAHYLRRTFQALANGTNSGTSIKEFWDSYQIEDAAENISESWRELKQTTMNYIWKQTWPDCVKTKETEVDSLTKVREDILSLANNLGFEDLEESDVSSLLDVDRELLSLEELIQLETDAVVEVKQEPEESQGITPEVVTDAVSHFEEGMNILLQNDPDNERSAKVCRAINSAIAFYKEMMETNDIR